MAMARVSAATAPFEAQYAARLAMPTAATTEAVLTMVPPPLAFITGIAYLLQRNTPRTLTAISASQASSSVSTTLPGSVVDEDVEAPEPLRGRRDHPLDVGGAGDVGHDRNRLHALACALRGDGLRVGRVLVGDDEPRAFAGEQQSGRPADAGAAARDDADLVLEAHRSASRSIRIFDPAQNVARDRHPHAVLIHDLDVGERLPLLRIDLGDGVGERDGIADEHRRKETHAVVAERHGRRLARGASAFVDHHGRAGRHVADDQRAVRDAPAEFRVRHVLLVDMIYREISGDPSKEVDVGFPDLDVEVLHCASRTSMRSRTWPRSIRWKRRRHHVSSTRTTPSRASAAISAAPKPSSPRTSLVCAPSRCGGRRMAAASPS